MNRAQWFAELSTALDEGERALGELIAAQISPIEVERLRLRLIELRAELDRLNRVRLTEERVVGSSWPGSETHLARNTRPLHPDWRPGRD